MENQLNKGEVRPCSASAAYLLRKVLWVIILLGLTQAVSAQQKPDWLNNYPDDPRFYIGIGGVNKSDTGTGYTVAAQQNALSELVSQIEVTISGSLQLIQQESNNEVNELFNSMITTQVNKTIEEFEVVDRWETEEEFWVYLRLSKSEYRARLQEKMSIAKRQSASALQDGNKAFAEQRWSEAMAAYVRGISDIAPFLDQPMEIQTTDGSIDLFAAYRSQLSALLGFLEMGDATGPTEAQVGQPGNTPFLVTVSSSQDANPVENIPVGFSFIRGDGDIVSPAFTNNLGSARTELRKITAPDQIQIIAATIDLAAFAEEDARPLLAQIFESLNKPTTRFVVRVAGVPVYLQYTERFLGKKRPSEYLEPVFKEGLNNAGYTFIDEISSAEWLFEVNATIKQGSETYGLYTAFLSYQITATNMLTGEQVANYSLNDVKGISDSYEKAGAKAFEIGIDSLQQSLMGKIISSIQR